MIITAVTTKQRDLDQTIKDYDLHEYPIIHLNQVHGAELAHIEDPKVATIQKPEADAAYTSLRNVVIAIKTADCLPILFSHPSGVVGGIHAGRKSTDLGITRHVFNHFKKAYGLDRSFTIHFGPAICKACYQVDPILDLHYDLVSENRSQLNDVLEMDHNHLTLSSECTSCNNDRYFSYRKENTSSRIFSLICSI